MYSGKKWKEKIKGIQKRKLIWYFTCECNSYILILCLKNMSSQKIYTFWWCAVNNEVLSTSSQILEQIDVVQEVVLPGISKLTQH